MTQTTARVVHADEASISEASKIVIAGGIIAYPTDTVYGLGCDPFNADAVNRVIQAKLRPKGGLPILINSMVAAKKLGEFNRTAMVLAGRFWPGAITLLVPVLQEFPDPITDNSQLIGLRIPKHETALNLIEKCHGNIVGTSANVSGQPSPRTAEEVLSALGDRVDMILDGGPSAIGRDSTVAKIMGLGVEVLREGAVSRDEILKALQFG